MSKSSLFSCFSSAALALALVSQAGATTVTIGGTSVAGHGQMTSVAGATTLTFDGLTALPSNFSTYGNTPAQPLVSGSTATYKTPTDDNTTYLTTGIGMIVEALPTSTTYLGFYLGSLDTYNSFGIQDNKGNVFSLSGADLVSRFNLKADGDSSYFVNLFADPGTSFAYAGFNSTNYALEVDNIASATPEPGSVAMLAGGLLILCGAIRRRKA